jgi:hypothetical protein
LTHPGSTDTLRGVTTLGTRFAEALAVKDFDRVESLLHPEIDFAGLTPSREWAASDPAAVIRDILRQWLEESDEVDEVLTIDSDSVADRERVGYRFAGHNDDGPFVMEQQAYLSERDGRIGWMRVICSGMRPPDAR